MLKIVILSLFLIGCSIDSSITPLDEPLNGFSGVWLAGKYCEEVGEKHVAYLCEDDDPGGVFMFIDAMDDIEIIEETGEAFMSGGTEGIFSDRVLYFLEHEIEVIGYPKTNILYLKQGERIRMYEKL